MHFLLLFIILLQSGGEVLAEDFSPFHTVFESCFNSTVYGNGPSLSDNNNTMVFTSTVFASAANGSFVPLDYLTSCLKDTAQTEAGSSDSTLWFFANTFNMDTFKESIYTSLNALASLAPELYVGGNFTATECFEFQTSSGFFEECAQNVTTLVHEMKQNGDPDITDVCASVAIMTCMVTPEMMDEHNCTNTYMDFLAASFTLYNIGSCMPGPGEYEDHGNYYGSYNGSMDYPHMPDMPDTAFLHCGHLVLEDVDPSMIFPPSESMIDMITEMDNAKEEHSRSITKFCSHVAEYSECLKLGLLSPNSSFDETLGQVIDPYKIVQAFDYYCANKDVIESNYECVLDQLKMGNVCGGGIMDIMMSVDASMMYQGSIDSICSGSIIKDQCRLKDKFNTCSTSFGNVMITFYDMLRSPRCQQYSGGPGMGGEMEADILRCVGEYGMGASMRFEEMSQNSGEGEEAFYAIIEQVKHEMNTICSLKKQTMACINDVYSTSFKPADRLVFKVMIPDNIQIIVDHFCEMVPDLSRHAACLVMNVYQSVAMGSACFANLQYEMMMIGEANANIDSPDDLNRAIEQICGKIPSITNCLAESFAMCNSKVASKFRGLGAKVAASCNNPESIFNKAAHGIAPVHLLLIVVSLTMALKNVLM